MQATLENLTTGTVVVHGNKDRTVVAVATPVYPRGSQADRSMRANLEHGYYTLRVIMDDGTSMLVGPNNVLLASRI